MILACCLAATVAVQARPGGVRPMAAPGPATPKRVDPLRPFLRMTVRGGITAGATCIYREPLGSGGPYGGDLVLAGVPLGATVVRALLYWSVLSESLPAPPGQPAMDGSRLVPVLLASLPETPCFRRQPHTSIYRADVTSLVDGDGTYALSGFPFDEPTVLTEGATLIAIYCDPGAPETDVVVLDGIDVLAEDDDRYTQVIDGFQAAADAPVRATLVAVIGNGQLLEPDHLLFNGVDLDAQDPSLLSGAACENGYYDLTMVDVSGLVSPGSSEATLRLEVTGDCYDIGAVALAVESGSGSSRSPEPSAVDANPTVPPLRVRKSAPDTLVVSWEPLGRDAEHGLDAGAIGSWYDHQAVACSLATPVVELALPAEDTYYVASARSCGAEPSGVGRDSFGWDRPTSLESGRASCW